MLYLKTLDLQISSSEHEALALGIRQWKAVAVLLLFQGEVNGRPRPNAVWCRWDPSESEAVDAEKYRHI